METTTIIRKTLTVSTFDVFEKMFYIFLEITSLPARQNDLVTSLAFSGPFDGKVRLYLPASLARAMAENMLSMHRADITYAMMEDCAKEAVSMIGGRFLRTLDPTRAFNVSVPACSPNASIVREDSWGVQEDSSGSDPEEGVNFESERGNLRISVSLKDSESHNRK